MVVLPTNPFSEIQFVFSLLQAGWKEFRYLRKKHLFYGFIICGMEYFISSQTLIPSFSQYSYSLHQSFCDQCHPNTFIVCFYILLESILSLILQILIQRFLLNLYWIRRCRDKSFRNSILLHSEDHSIDPLDGFMMIYPWMLCPILICNSMLHLVIQSTFYFGPHHDADAIDSAFYHLIRCLLFLIAYCCINLWIAMDDVQHHLFTMDPVIQCISSLCLSTTRSLLSVHFMYIEDLSNLVMDYIGPDPLPQFGMIKLKLMQSMQRMDLEYVSRLITFIVTIYSVIKIYFNSYFEQNESDPDPIRSNIYVSFATAAGVILFGHTVRKVVLCFISLMVNVFTFNIPFLHWSIKIILAAVCGMLLSRASWTMSQLAKQNDEGSDIVAAVVFDNVLSKDYEYMFSPQSAVYLRWTRAAFTQLGCVMLAAMFGFVVRTIMFLSYGNASRFKAK